MCDFAIFGLPRSATTWAANWLSRDGVVCRHDPLAFMTPEEILAADGGMACTGFWMRPDWVAELNCPVVVVHRHFDEVNQSLRRIGLPEAPRWMESRLAETSGMHVNYRDLFDQPAAADIWYALRGDVFDPIRHSEQCRMNIQPQYARCVPNASVLRQFMQGVA